MTSPDPEPEPVRTLLATIAPMLPITVFAAICQGLHIAARQAGWRETTVNPALEVRAILPEPGTRPAVHLIEISPSQWHPGRGLLAWACSCTESGAFSFTDLGRAAGDAVEHIQPGETWTIEPHNLIIGLPGPQIEAPD